MLSREALKRFNQGHQKPNTTCRKYGGHEDIEIRACLRSEGVYMGNARDKENRELFHPLNFHDHFVGPIPDWYKDRAALEPATVSIFFFAFSTVKLIILFQRVTSAAVTT